MRLRLASPQREVERLGGSGIEVSRAEARRRGENCWRELRDFFKGLTYRGLEGVRLTANREIHPARPTGWSRVGGPGEGAAVLLVVIFVVVAIMILGLEAVVDGFEQRAVGQVAAELPNHYAAEMMVADIVHFECDGGGIFVGPKILAVEEPWRLRDGIAELLELDSNRNDGVVARAKANGTAGFEQAVVNIGNVAPFVAIERNSKNNFPGMDARFQIGGDGGIDVVAGIAVLERTIERRDEAGGGVPWAIEIVEHEIEVRECVLNFV